MSRKLLFVFVILFITATLAQAQPNVPILEVDTLAYLGKGIAGEAGGAFFLPDGNIIALWKGIPTVIDSKTGTIIRNLEELPNQNVDFPALSADGRYFVAYSKKGTAIWDVNTGKVIKFITVANGYAFSPDGSKMYCTAENDSKDPGIIIEYDMNTLERIDRFCHDDFKAGDHIAISPDGQTLAVSLYKPQDNPYDEKTNQVILIDLKDKTKYTVLETLEPTIYSMEFSPDGKYLMYRYIGSNNNVYIYIYNFETMEKTYLNKSDLAKLHDIKDPAMYDSFFLNGNTIIIPISSAFDHMEYSFIYDITKKELKKIIKFATSAIDIKNNSLLLCSYFGAIALLDLSAVSVNELRKTDNGYINFANNQLEYYSYTSFLGTAQIYDISGKIVADLGSRMFEIGKNTLQFNQTFPVGVYILTIKTDKEQISKKFIVDR